MQSERKCVGKQYQEPGMPQVATFYIPGTTDQCNNTIQHIQTITVNLAPLPVFVNPPTNITVACNQIPSIAPNFEYNNNALVVVSVQGFVLESSLALPMNAEEF
ncbi:MAG: hypothetical protein IPF52_14370 [Saprospiraceae bacterium]|nr:hypothetical protein [Saprospiraceae bacterium]